MAHAGVSYVGDLVVTPRLRVRGNPDPFRNPPKSFVRREAGHQQPDISHGRKQAPSLPELGPQFREAEILKNIENNSNDSPETRGRVLADGRRQLWPPATSPPESGATRIGAAAGGRDAGRGPCWRRITRVEKPKKPSEAHAGPLVLLVPEDGAGTNLSASLWI
jgi:hypothetical protein